LIKIIKELNIEVSKPNIFQAIVAKQYDMNTRFIKATFVDGGEKILISPTATVAVIINAERPDGLSKGFDGVVNEDGTTSTYEENVYIYTGVADYNEETGEYEKGEVLLEIDAFWALYASEDTTADFYSLEAATASRNAISGTYEDGELVEGEIPTETEEENEQ
jgi:hypothetical protein